MPFPPSAGVQIGNLTAATPTVFTSDDLKTQLEAIGLDCAQLTDENLQSYLDEVTSQLPSNGQVESFMITMPPSDPTAAVQPAEGVESLSVLSLAANLTQSQEAATGNWTISDKAQGYAPQLEVIQKPAHFQWLYANNDTNGFTGVTDAPPASTGNYPNAAAIQKLFVSVGTTASATLVKGLDQATIQAALSNVIQPLTDDNLKNYYDSTSRAIYLVDNYNASTGYADGVGVLSIAWTLTITDWQRKTKDGGDTHPTSLQITAESVLYSDPAVLCTDYNAVLKQFGIDSATAPPCPLT